jgi:hypothetical protein
LSGTKVPTDVVMWISIWLHTLVCAPLLPMDSHALVNVPPARLTGIVSSVPSVRRSRGKCHGARVVECVEFAGQCKSRSGNQTLFLCTPIRRMAWATTDPAGSSGAAGVDAVGGLCWSAGHTSITAWRQRQKGRSGSGVESVEGEEDEEEEEEEVVVVVVVVALRPLAEERGAGFSPVHP